MTEARAEMKLLKKPLFRGHVHQAAFFISLGACLPLIANASGERSMIASLVYSFGLLFLFGTSAIYHRIHWQPEARALMKRLDHSAIFVLIAGTFTPFCLLALNETDGKNMLIGVWIAALLGVLQSVFWVKAPRWLTAIFYVVIGWSIFPYLHELQISIGSEKLIFLGMGGVVYTVGAIFYALKKPWGASEVFGYHELFHVMTVIGAALHFIVIYQIIK